MFSLLREFMSRAGVPVRIILMEDDPSERPMQYRVDPGRIVWALAGLIAAGVLLVVSLVLFTPVRSVLPGYTTEEMQRDARLNRMRLLAMEDSLRRQDAYMRRLRDLMLGYVDTTAIPVAVEEAVPGLSGDVDADDLEPTSDNWEDHEVPALPINRLRATDSPPMPVRPTPVPSGRFLSGLAFPVLPPVDGFVSRGFQARIGHYAIDIVVEEGSVVRSIGEGYVIMADWTHDGGQVIAVQHADGYISIYKHNSSLLKRVGDAVRSRDAIALSGNSGEITTGPHLHFELWQNGLAQNPRDFLIGLQ